MRVLVTGAKGRIGKHLVRAMAEKYEVRGVDREEVDLAEASEEQLASLLRGTDAIVHLAGILDYGAPDEVIMKVNCGATEKLAKAAAKAKIKRFVLMSSCSIWHGDDLPTPITEKTPRSPDSAYGRSKMCAEEALRKSGVSFVILRAPAIYGKDFREGFGAVVKLVKKGRMPLIGSGKNVISFVHVDDVVRALMLALKTENADEDYIVTSGERLTQEECLRAVAKACNIAPRFIRLPVVIAKIAAFFMGIRQRYIGELVENRVFDITKARSRLGYAPKIRISDGLKEMI
ncbi:L-arabinose 1-dehydrogenase (NAD(P)(+)) [Candidatus Norongarragalina meridionalis]|nr:L-arabinose 1-dehydrogenase (NAD(P)(+)) [Candidatus Norongarragalina meridionalis]